MYSTQKTTAHLWALHPMLLITLSVFASISQADETPTTQLEAIEVKAQQPKKMDTASATILLEEINRQKAATSDTAQLLKNIPGVSVYSAGGVSSLPAIRGQADDRLRIKVNGADFISSCPNHMNSPLSYIDPTHVHKIDVFAGITPASVGGDSTGGTIVVESNTPKFAEKEGTYIKSGEFGVYSRSNGDGFGSNLGAHFASNQLSLEYTGAYAKSDNYHSAKDFKGHLSNPVVPNTLEGTRTIPNNEVGESRYETKNHALNIAHRSGQHQFDARIGFQHIPNEGFPNQRMDMTDNKSLQLNLGYKGQFDWGDLEARAYRERTTHTMDFDKDKVFYYFTPAVKDLVTAAGMPMYTKGTTLGATVSSKIALNDRHGLKSGLELQSYRLDDWWPPSPANNPNCPTADGVKQNPLIGMCGMAPNTFWNINNGKRDRYGVFTDWNSQWNTRWSTLIGARLELVRMNAGNVQGYNNYIGSYGIAAAEFNAKDRNKNDINLDINASAKYAISDRSNYEFGVARKTRSPNLYERYTWSKHPMVLAMINMVGDGNGYVGNVSLKPEKAHTLAAAYSWHNDTQNTRFKIAPYFTQIEDYIDVKRCQETAAPTSYCGGTAKQNSTATNKFVHLEYTNATARMYGIDISASTSLYQNDTIGRFEGSAAFNYVRGKNTDSQDNLYNIMPMNARLGLTHQLKGWDSQIEWQLVKGKNNVSQVRQELKTAGYGLLNLRTGYTWKNVQLNIGIENALNKQYSLPLGGAYVGQGYTMSLNAENGGGMTGTSMYGIAVPGAGRSYYAGLNVKF